MIERDNAHYMWDITEVHVNAGAYKGCSIHKAAGTVADIQEYLYRIANRERNQVRDILGGDEESLVYCPCSANDVRINAVAETLETRLDYAHRCIYYTASIGADYVGVEKKAWSLRKVVDDGESTTIHVYGTEIAAKQHLAAWVMESHAVEPSQWVCGTVSFREICGKSWRNDDVLEAYSSHKNAEIEYTMRPHKGTSGTKIEESYIWFYDNETAAVVAPNAVEALKIIREKRIPEYAGPVINGGLEDATYTWYQLIRLGKHAPEMEPVLANARKDSQMWLLDQNHADDGIDGTDDRIDSIMELFEDDLRFDSNGYMVD